MNFLNTLSSGNKKWLTVTRWLLILGCWVLIAVLVGKARDWKVKQDYLQLGPESIVGEHSVIYQEAPAYLYTNPVAMICHNMRCLGVQAGIVLLFAVLATVSLWTWKTLSKRRVWSRCIPILFGIVMSLLFCYLAVVCVWEWGLCWLAILLYFKFAPRWSLKSAFTLAALIATVALVGFRRMELNNVARFYDSFWETIGPCTTLQDFKVSYGEPVFIRKHVSEEDKEWFDALAQFDWTLWQPGKNLYGFVSPRMPDILLLPWFDDDGQSIVVAWCSLTPKRRELLQNKQQPYDDKK